MLKFHHFTIFFRHGEIKAAPKKQKQAKKNKCHNFEKGINLQWPVRFSKLSLTNKCRRARTAASRCPAAACACCTWARAQEAARARGAELTSTPGSAASTASAR
ncbi:unnamed protein product [Leptidea sinapis]|uniref:Uncharacterized protein n=1 Tax=Leptidea sinapis TaxID=189913 RepID=A0A5E4R892_9NEOP|nr:unnamed protein product [Leptidea sinapis]